MSGQTITEKLLARAAGRDRVQPGEIVTCDLDLCMGNDITAPLAIAALEEHGVTRLADPDKVAIVLSHFAPARDVRSAVQCQVARAFAKKHGLPIRQVITPADGSEIDIGEGAYVDYGLLVNSGEYDGMDFDAAFNAIADRFEETGRGKRACPRRIRCRPGLQT